MVKLVESKAEFELKLTEAGTKLVVVDFFATWCGPCKTIAPEVEELERNNPNVVFLKVDIDDNDDLALQYDITAMPTFVFIRGKETLDHFAGANLTKLKELIEKFSPQ